MTLKARIRRATAVALTTLAAGVAFGVAGSAPGADAVDTALEVDVATVDFGPVPVGDTVEVSVTVTNAGSGPVGPLTFNAFDLGLPAPFDRNQDCTGATLAPGDVCRVTYTFSPHVPGDFGHDTAFVLFATDLTVDAEEFAVALTGVGVIPLSVTPSSLDFGDVAVGSTSAQLHSVVTNIGAAAFGPIHVLGAAPAASAFDMELNCDGDVLAPGGTCLVLYRFAPATPGADSAESTFVLSPTTSAANGAAYSIDLTGNGFVDTPLAIAETSVGFGDVLVGGRDLTVVTVENTGAAPFGPITTFGGLPSTDSFRRYRESCNGTTLPPAGECYLGFEFAPQTSGEFSDVASPVFSATGAEDDGEMFAIGLTGTGVPFPLSVAPTGLDFGAVGVGAASPPLAAVVTNITGGPVGPITLNSPDVEPPSAEFAATQDCHGATLPSQGTCRIAYVFAPMSPGSLTDRSAFFLNVGGFGDRFFVDLAGCGDGPGTPCLPPAATSTTPTADPPESSAPAEDTSSTMPPDPTTTSPTAVSPPIRDALHIAKSSGGVDDIDDDGVDAGDAVTFYLVVSNTGSETLDRVTVRDPLAGGAVPCGTGTLPPGTSRRCSPAVYALRDADLGTALTNTATAWATAPGGDIVSASDTAVVIVPPACIAATQPTTTTTTTASTTTAHDPEPADTAPPTTPADTGATPASTEPPATEPPITEPPVTEPLGTQPPPEATPPAAEPADPPAPSLADTQPASLRRAATGDTPTANDGDPCAPPPAVTPWPPAPHIASGDPSACAIGPNVRSVAGVSPASGDRNQPIVPDPVVLVASGVSLAIIGRRVRRAG